MKRITNALRALGPYAAIELLLPGGSLVALSVWGFRNRTMLAQRARRAFSRSTSSGMAPTSGADRGL